MKIGIKLFFDMFSEDILEMSKNNVMHSVDFEYFAPSAYIMKPGYCIEF